MTSSFKKTKSVKLVVAIFVSCCLTKFEISHAAEVVDFRQFIRQVSVWHPDIQEQKARVDAAEAEIEGSRSGRLPTISVGGSYSSETSESGTARFTVPIYTFGRITNEIEISGERYRLAQLGLLVKQNKVVQEASELYIKYLSETRRLAVFRENHTELNLLLERIKRRRISGYDSDADENSAKSRVLQSGAKVMRQEVLLKSMLGELAVIYGKEISDVVPLPKEFFGVPKSTDLNALILNQNLGLLEAEQRVVIAEREIRLARLNNRPNIEAFASDDLKSSVSSNTSVGINIQYDWKNLGRSVASKIGSAEALLRAAQSAYAGVKQDVRVQLIKARTNIESLSKQISEQDSIVRSLTETKASFSRQYEAGRKSLMELLNIHNELAEAKSQKILLETQLFEAQIDIYSLSGSMYLAAEREDLPSQLSIINQNKSGAQ